MNCEIGHLMVDVQGLQLTEDDKYLLAQPRVGGIILFARNYSSTQQLQELVAQIRQCSESLIIAVDQEGGRVQRFKEGFVRLPPMNKLSQLEDENSQQAQESAFLCGWLMASELLAYGIDISFAPVLDIKTGVNPMIGDRAFSHDPETVIVLAKSFMAGMHEAGMATTGKHFPGHGSVAADSHFESPVDERTLLQIKQLDLKPFSALINDLDAVMPAHITYSQVDGSCAGFSKYWLQTMLRDELGFQGVVFSDDLSMSGARAGPGGGIKSKVKVALDAGCDMVLVCNNRDNALQALEYLEEQKIPSSAKMSSMRAVAGTSIEELQKKPRWGQAKNAIEQLLAY